MTEIDFRTQLNTMGTQARKAARRLAMLSSAQKGQCLENMAAKLLAVAGVVEAVVMAEDGVAYLKVDRHALDEEALQAFSAPGD